MSDFKKYVVYENTSIYNTIKLINKNVNKTLLVVKKILHLREQSQTEM